MNARSAVEMNSRAVLAIFFAKGIYIVLQAYACSAVWRIILAAGKSRSVRRKITWITAGRSAITELAALVVIIISARVPASLFAILAIY